MFGTTSNLACLHINDTRFDKINRETIEMCRRKEEKQAVHNRNVRVYWSAALVNLLLFILNLANEILNSSERVTRVKPPL